MAREIKKALAYLRTSSAANVGADRDSAVRQRDAIASFAKSYGFTIVQEFNDEAVSGADAIEARPGFSALLDTIESNGVRTVIVEDASRFARQVLVQELGVMALQQRAVQIFTAGGDELTATDDPSKVMIRQMMAAFAQFEKARLVAKLAAARKRRRAAIGKCEGRKSHLQIRPEVVELAKQLRRKKPKGERMSFAQIGQELAARGYMTGKGTPFGPSAVMAMVNA